MSTTTSTRDGKATALRERMEQLAEGDSLECEQRLSNSVRTIAKRIGITVTCKTANGTTCVTRTEGDQHRQHIATLKRFPWATLNAADAAKMIDALFSID